MDPLTTAASRYIQFSAENTIGLDPNLWYKPPLRKFVDALPFWGALLAVVEFSVWMTLELDLLGMSLACMIALLIVTISSYIPYACNMRSKKLVRKYRTSKVDEFVKLLEDQGFQMQEEDKASISTSSSSSCSFHVRDRNGVQYRTDYVLVTDKTIKASFLLSDPEAARAMEMHGRQTRAEGRALAVTEHYVSQNGEFSTPEERKAFLAGAKAALEW